MVLPRPAAALVLVLGSLLVSCGDGGSADPEWVAELQADRGETGVTIGPPASTASPASTVPDDEPPPLDNQGDDFDRIWREIEAFESWLLAHPDRTDLLERIYVPDGEIHGKTTELLADLEERNAFMVVDDYAVLDVRLVERPDDDTAVVRYRDTRSARRFVSRSTGEVLDREVYENQPWTWDLTLGRNDDGRWRIASITFVEDTG